MTSTLDGTLAGTGRSRASLVTAWRWALPVAGTTVGWLSVWTIAGTRGHGHVHHLLGIAAMSVAMMSPLAYPVCLAAARSSLWTSSTRCVTAAFAAFLAVWVAAGAVLHVATELVLAVVPDAALTAALAAWCAYDTVSLRRAQRLAACTVTRPLLPGVATLGALDLGITAGRRCLGTCGAVMALAVAMPVLAVPVSAIILVERLVEPRPRWWLATAFALLAVGAAVSIWR